MNYSHNLRNNIEAWKDRLARASDYNQFYLHLKFFINKIENELILQSIIKETILLFPYEEGGLKKTIQKLEHGDTNLPFEKEEQQTAFCYQMISYLISTNYDRGDVLNLVFVSSRQNYEDKKIFFIEQFVSPITNFLHDRLYKSSSTIYLLEKYKRRTEWFKKDVLYSQYKKAVKNYEKMFEDDLLLFLFDQGIDYPFSTPGSTSGRADIIGEIDTEDPLIIEIKIFDSEKDYRKNRIIEGFTQTVKYTNDYNKDFGYLVVFILDEVDINFNFKENDNFFPPRLSHGNKNYFFIVINLKPLESASKLGKTKTIEITESDMMQQLIS